MTLARGRVLHLGVDARGVTAVPVSGRGPMARGRVEKAAAVEATARAARIVADAEARAGAIVRDAEAKVADVRASAAAEGRAAGAAELSAAWLRMRSEESGRAARDLDQAIDLARTMAERLLGEALALDPARITGIARAALAQARRARHVTIDAHPDDAAALAGTIAELGLEQAAVQIQADAARPRGSLRVHTDLGTLDADLSLQLDRLAAALRDGLRSG